MRSGAQDAFLPSVSKLDDAEVNHYRSCVATSISSIYRSSIPHKSDSPIPDSTRIAAGPGIGPAGVIVQSRAGMLMHELVLDLVGGHSGVEQFRGQRPAQIVRFDVANPGPEGGLRDDAPQVGGGHGVVAHEVTAFAQRHECEPVAGGLARLPGPQFIQATEDRHVIGLIPLGVAQC